MAEKTFHVELRGGYWDGLHVEIADLQKFIEINTRPQKIGPAMVRIERYAITDRFKPEFNRRFRIYKVVDKHLVSH